MRRLEKDEWGRPIVYLAEWHDYIGASGSCVFTRLEPAIFFVITALGNTVDWKNFPDPTRKYPYEERHGDLDLDPVFVVERDYRAYPNGSTRKISGYVRRTSVSDDWVVGNGIAEAGKEFYALATGKDLVVLSGKGDKLTGRVGGSALKNK